MRQGPLFFETPTAAMWEYDRDDLLGLMEVTYAPNMFMRSEAYGADEFFEIQGTDGFIWVTRYTGQMLDLPPLMLYDADGTRPRRSPSVDASWVNSFRTRRRTSSTRSLDGPPARDGRRARPSRCCSSASPSTRRPSSAAPSTRRPIDRVGVAAVVAAVRPLGLTAGPLGAGRCRPAEPGRWSRIRRKALNRSPSGRFLCREGHGRTGAEAGHVATIRHGHTMVMSDRAASEINRHLLLERQLRRLAVDVGPPDEKRWSALLRSVDAAYERADRDRRCSSGARDVERRGGPGRLAQRLSELLEAAADVVAVFELVRLCSYVNRSSAVPRMPRHRRRPHDWIPDLDASPPSRGARSSSCSTARAAIGSISRRSRPCAREGTWRGEATLSGTRAGTPTSLVLVAHRGPAGDRALLGDRARRDASSRTCSARSSRRRRTTR